MKPTAFFLFTLLLPALGEPPEIGATANDVTFSEGMNLSGGSFGSLTDTMLSNQGGKVLLLAYATPW
ncbi:hypothetical protein V2O64_10535 [Verrucomicrobiaceae bacterium 227]